MILLHQIDAFTSEAFHGNPAAVCLLDAADPRAKDERWMQNVAMEMNLSETAYLVRRAPGRFDLRWFTPLAEAELCGHATLASAHALWELGIEKAGELRFDSGAGPLFAYRETAGWIRLDFPLLAETPAEIPGLEAALGTRPVYVGENPSRFLAELPSEDAVRALRPNLEGLARLGRDVMVTARSRDPAFDFVSRYFSPIDGIGEDPVTGSAHCLLAPYWGRKLGKTELTGFQASHRGGVVRARVNAAQQRVALFGQAVTTARIELLQ